MWALVTHALRISDPCSSEGLDLLVTAFGLQDLFVTDVVQQHGTQSLGTETASSAHRG